MAMRVEGIHSEISIDDSELGAAAARARRELGSVEDTMASVSRQAQASNPALRSLAEGFELLTQGSIRYSDAKKTIVDATGQEVSSLQILNRIGIQTREQIEAQLRALDDLKAAYRDDAQVASQLALQQARLQARLQGSDQAAGAAARAVFSLGRIAEGSTISVRAVANDLIPLTRNLALVRQEAQSTGTTVTSTLVSALKGPAGLGIALAVVSTALVLFERRTQRAKEKLAEQRREAQRLRQEQHRLIDSTFRLSDAQRTQGVSVQELNGALAQSRLARERIFQRIDQTTSQRQAQELRRQLREVEAVQFRITSLQKEAADQARLRNLHERLTTRTLASQAASLREIVRQSRERQRQLLQQQKTIPQQAQLGLAERFFEEENRGIQLRKEIELLRGEGGTQLRATIKQNKELERQRNKLLGINTNEKRRLASLSQILALQQRIRTGLGLETALARQLADTYGEIHTLRHIFNRRAGRSPTPLPTPLDVPEGTTLRVGSDSLRTINPADFFDAFIHAHRLREELDATASLTRVIGAGIRTHIKLGLLEAADTAAGRLTDTLFSAFSPGRRLAAAQLEAQQASLRAQLASLRENLAERQVSYAEYAAQVKLINLEINRNQRELARTTGTVIERTFLTLADTIRGTFDDLARDITRSLIRAGLIRGLGSLLGLSTGGFGSLFLGGLGLTQQRTLPAPSPQQSINLAPAPYIVGGNPLRPSSAANIGGNVRLSGRLTTTRRGTDLAVTLEEVTLLENS